MITSLRNLLKPPIGRRQRILNVNASLSRPGISGIPLYEPYFYVSQQSSNPMKVVTHEKVPSFS
jgi:hypothetical protein